MNPNKMFILLALFCMSANSAYCNNEAVSYEMRSVISSSGLPQNKKQVLIRTVDEVFRSAKEVEPDKTKMAKPNLSVYLSERLLPAKDYTDEQFAVIARLFRHDLQNYVSLEAIDDNQRNLSKKKIEELMKITREFIDVVYFDKALGLRESIYSEVVGRVKNNSGRIGNYFYPQFLYLKPEELARDDVIAQMTRSVPKNTKDIAVTLIDPVNIYNSIQAILRSMFTLDEAYKQKKIQPISRELVREQQDLYRDLSKEYKSKYEAVKNRQKYEDAILKVKMVESYSKMVNGLAVDKIALKNDQAERVRVVEPTKVAVDQVSDHLDKSGEKKPAKVSGYRQRVTKLGYALMLGIGLIILGIVLYRRTCASSCRS